MDSEVTYRAGLFSLIQGFGLSEGVGGEFTFSDPLIKSSKLKVNGPVVIAWQPQPIFGDGAFCITLACVNLPKKRMDAHDEF